MKLKVREQLTSKESMLVLTHTSTLPTVCTPPLSSLILPFLQTSKIIKKLSICTYINYVRDILKNKTFTFTFHTNIIIMISTHSRHNTKYIPATLKQ